MSIAIIIAAAAAVTFIIICSTSAASVAAVAVVVIAAVAALSDINVVSRAQTRPKWSPNCFNQRFQSRFWCRLQDFAQSIGS